MTVPFNPIEISVVVPVYNEEGSVVHLYTEIEAVLRAMGLTFEIIFVDDGSTDGTAAKLKTLRLLRVIRLRKNYGQSCALDAGVKAARGKFIVTLDGDGQNDPADIPLLWRTIQNGYSVVCGWRFKRKDSFLKRFISLGARFLRRRLVDDDIHDAGCTLRIYRRECFEDLDLYGELHRMIPALLKWRGFKITEVKVNHRPRIAGCTKYGWDRVLKGFLDMLYVWFWRKYAFRPLHLFGAFGIFFMLFGSLLLLFLTGLKIFLGYQLSNKIWPLVGFFSVSIGVQFLMMGFLAANLVDQNRARKYSVESMSGE
ncbi:MAG TPA: glycosyltransferase family 2 protein [Candidatus Omnitrophota bacterium]|nr:glycosyltransferase family 2 protein [Candidatus Omnitrophota bacterium]HPD84097.1 glycosyltransferase family 2 protein [Candidatus Omnitrophota bacterium]HRZ02954.1 glycosyltransferase family 2 protein [Candidatus Omnitrophota bacterium]